MRVRRGAGDERGELSGEPEGFFGAEKKEEENDEFFISGSNSKSEQTERGNFGERKEGKVSFEVKRRFQPREKSVKNSICSA